MPSRMRPPGMGSFGAPESNLQTPTAEVATSKASESNKASGSGLTGMFNNADIVELITKFGDDKRGAEEFLASLLRKANVSNWTSISNKDPAIDSMINYAATLDADFKGDFKGSNPRDWRSKLDRFVKDQFASGGNPDHRDPPEFIRLLFIFAGETVPEDLASRSTAELAILLLQRMGLDVPDWLRPETERSYLAAQLEAGELYTGEATVENKGVLQIVYTPGGMPEIDFENDTTTVEGAVAVHSVHNPDNALIRALADLDVFHTVVVSAHGTEEGILACDSSGYARVMEPTELASCIADSSISNVILAACYGATQGEDETRTIDIGGFGLAEFGETGHEGRIVTYTIPDKSVAETLAQFGFNVAAFDGLVSEADVASFLGNVADAGGFDANGSNFLEVAQGIDKEDDNIGTRQAANGNLPTSVLDEIKALRDKVDALMRTGELERDIDEVMDEFERTGHVPPQDGKFREWEMY